jgi:flagellar biosynthesis protein FliQ
MFTVSPWLVLMVLVSFVFVVAIFVGIVVAILRSANKTDTTPQGPRRGRK